MSAPYEFDRYRDGQLMAESIQINKAKSLEEASAKAARLADSGDVVVYRPPAPTEQAANPVAEAARCAKFLLNFCEHDEVTELVLKAIVVRDGDTEKDAATFKSALRALQEGQS